MDTDFRLFVARKHDWAFSLKIRRVEEFWNSGVQSDSFQEFYFWSTRAASRRLSFCFNGLMAWLAVSATHRMSIEDRKNEETLFLALKVFITRVYMKLLY
jgi:hypothetical protein